MTTGAEWGQSHRDGTFVPPAPCYTTGLSASPMFQRIASRIDAQLSNVTSSAAFAELSPTDRAEVVALELRVMLTEPDGNDLDMVRHD